MEKYLRKCLDSLVVDYNVLFDKLEVLVVNDGSRDSSSAIAHEYQDNYPNVFRVIDKENGNYGSCVNCGLKEANGKYIKILDADDSFDTRNFEEFLLLLAGVDVDLIISDFDIVSESGKIKRSFTYHLKPMVKGDFLDYVSTLKNIQMHAVTYKCENLKRINYFQTEGVSYTDLEWIFFPMTTVKTICYFNKVVYKYLVGRSGQTVDYSVYHRRVLDRVKGTKTMIAEFKKDYLSIYKEYLEGKILGRLNGIYLSYLVVNREDSNMYEFDKYIEAELGGTIYEKMNEMNVAKFIIYRYIRRWRNTNMLPPYYITSIYLIIKRIQIFLARF